MADSDAEEREVYIVEDIVGKRVNRRTKKVEYLLKWKGYGPEANSWEEEDGLQCDELIRLFNANRDKQSSSSSEDEGEVVKRPAKRRKEFYEPETSRQPEAQPPHYGEVDVQHYEGKTTLLCESQTQRGYIFKYVLVEKFEAACKTKLRRFECRKCRRMMKKDDTHKIPEMLLEDGAKVLSVNPDCPNGVKHICGDFVKHGQKLTALTSGLPGNSKIKAKFFSTWSPSPRLLLENEKYSSYKFVYQNTHKASKLHDAYCCLECLKLHGNNTSSVPTLMIQNGVITSGSNSLHICVDIDDIDDCRDFEGPPTNSVEVLVDVVSIGDPASDVLEVKENENISKKSGKRGRKAGPRTALSSKNPNSEENHDDQGGPSRTSSRTDAYPFRSREQKETSVARSIVDAPTAPPKARSTEANKFTIERTLPTYQPLESQFFKFPKVVSMLSEISIVTKRLWLSHEECPNPEEGISLPSIDIKLPIIKRLDPEDLPLSERREIKENLLWTFENCRQCFKHDNFTNFFVVDSLFEALNDTVMTNTIVYRAKFPAMPRWAFDQICRLNFANKENGAIIYALGYDMIVHHSEHTPNSAARLVISELNEILDDIILKTSYECAVQLVYVTIPEIGDFSDMFKEFNTYIRASFTSIKKSAKTLIDLLDWARMINEADPGSVKTVDARMRLLFEKANDLCVL